MSSPVLSASSAPSRHSRSFDLPPRNTILRWSAYVLLALFCCYRLARFTPEPLDSAHTLRPILNSWFVAFLNQYQHPEPAYSAWKLLCFLALLAPPALALLNYARDQRMFGLPPWAVSILCSRLLLFAAIAFALVVCRFPTLLDYQLNPDEGEFLSAAHKLFYDGNFFHSVDCGTSGPLNIYPLMLPALIGLSPDYASSRVIVLLIAFILIWLTYRSVRLLTQESIARIAILPLAGAFAVFRDANFLHYSSEQIPLLLIAAALYCTVNVLRAPDVHRRQLLLLGLLASLGFFSKMQSVPVLVAFAFVAIAYTHASGCAGKLRRPALLFLAGLIPVFVVNAVVCLAGGVWHDFWMSYIVSNQKYVEVNASFFSDLPRFSQYLLESFETRFFLLNFLALAAAYAISRLRPNTVGEQGRLLLLTLFSGTLIGTLLALQYSDHSALIRYLALIAIATVPMYFLLFFRSGTFGSDPARWLGLLSVLAIGAALFSIYKPHRLFPHYLLFLFIPVTIATAWMLLRQSTGPLAADRSPPASSPSAFVLLFISLAVVAQTYLWSAQPDHRFRNVVSTIRSPEGDWIRSLTSAHARIFVWGWTPDPYLASGRVTASRDLNLFYIFIGPPEVTSYYRARLLHDLYKRPPELFIDAIGPRSWSFTDRNRYNFEQFPAIADFVNRRYLRLTDAYQHRYYLRRDLAWRAKSASQPRICAPGAVACSGVPPLAFAIDASLQSVVGELAPVELPTHALLEADFTPVARQTANATVFSNEAVPDSSLGLRFQNIGGDHYRLILGLGDRWAFSKSVLLPAGKPAALSIEIDQQNVYLRANGTAFDDMRLPSPIADAPGKITIGSWIDGQCRFTGEIRFFQILDLSSPPDQAGKS